MIDQPHLICAVYEQFDKGIFSTQLYQSTSQPPPAVDYFDLAILKVARKTKKCGHPCSSP